MTTDRRNRVILCYLFLCATIVCVALSLRSSPHQAALRSASFGLLLGSSWLQYRVNLKRSQPDPVTHLFADSQIDQGKK